MNSNDSNRDQAYDLMLNALRAAEREIHNPGTNRNDGVDIAGHLEEIIKFAARHAKKIAA